MFIVTHKLIVESHDKVKRCFIKRHDLTTCMSSNMGVLKNKKNKNRSNDDSDNDEDDDDNNNNNDNNCNNIDVNILLL